MEYSASSDWSFPSGLPISEGIKAPAPEGFIDVEVKGGDSGAGKDALNSEGE